jgi:hypothetical protein
MAYLGRKGASAPLTSADIPDSSITTAKIVDGTVAEGDLAFSTATQAELDAQRTNSSITTLGTVTAGNLSSEDIVMPRIKEIDRFYHGIKTTVTNDNHNNNINISGSDYVSMTPEHNDDIFMFQWNFNTYSDGGYMGWGIEMDDATAFNTSPAIAFRKGQHALGSHLNASDGLSDRMRYGIGDGSWSCKASDISATVGTTWHFRMMGQTHNNTVQIIWGQDSTASAKNIGVTMSCQRWSIV